MALGCSYTHGSISFTCLCVSVWVLGNTLHTHSHSVSMQWGYCSIRRTF